MPYEVQETVGEVAISLNDPGSAFTYWAHLQFQHVSEGYVADGFHLKTIESAAKFDGNCDVFLLSSWTLHTICF